MSVPPTLVQVLIFLLITIRLLDIKYREIYKSILMNNGLPTLPLGKEANFFAWPSGLLVNQFYKHPLKSLNFSVPML